MINLPFFKNTPKLSDKYLIVELNSSEIRVLAMYKEGANEKVIGVGRKKTEPGSIRAGSIVDLEKTASTLEEAIAEAVETQGEPVDNVIVGINADMSFGMTTTVRYKKPYRSLITDKEIKEIDDKVLETSSIQSQDEYLQFTGNSETELEIVTTANVYTKIDQYFTDSLAGKEGTIIETAVFNAFSPKHHLKNIQTLCKKTNLNIIAIGPEMYGLTKKIRQIQGSGNDFVILDITDDSTNATVVFKGGIVSTKSLGIGVNHIVESVSERMGVTNSEAHRMIESYISGNLSSSERDLIAGFIREIMGIWTMGLELLFKEFSGVKTFSQEIFVTGHGADIKDITDALETTEWTKALPFKNPPTFKTICTDNLTDISDSTGKAKGCAFVSMLGLTHIYEEIIGESNND